MKFLHLVVAALLLGSCNWFKQKTKDTVNKTGEVVGKAGSEFVNGVSKGVEKSFENAVVVSDALKGEGLHTGKVLINGTDSTSDNIVTAYLIFDKDLSHVLTVKVFTAGGQEYGRVSQPVTGKRNEARYVDFVFDKRTNIDGKGTITME
ncbi:MAG: hypothetical protein EOO12_03420 [Chitinophagaceae bacterium]|nr:MAG: hypothetical protein EOO12_03420 [Chitinophagaceae bacterium]